MGVRLSRPVDLLGEEIYSPMISKSRTYQGFYSCARNVRGYLDGTINARPGSSVVNASAMAGGAVHSLKELNDDVGPTLSTPTQDYAIFAGAGTKLYADNSAHNAFTEIASGLSGNQLTWIPHRPEQSPQPWMYIHDTAKLLKAKASAAGDATKSYQWGIAPPVIPLSIAIASPVSKTIDDFEAGTFGGWAASAGVLTNEDRVAAVAITYILYDTGTTGWACVNPAAIGEIREGMYLTTSASAETVIVDSVYKAVTSTTIGSIKYDSGTSGLCTIQLAAPTAELVMNSMLRVAAAENVRVLSVTYGPDGIPSFRCSTTATRAAGDAVAGLASFRAYFVSNHAPAETLSTKMIKEVTAAAGITTLTRTVALDLSAFASRPVLPSDQMVISFTIDNPSLVTEIQIQADVDATVQDFTKNYYFKSINAADLTPLVQQTLSQLTVQQRIIQRQQIRQAQRNYPRFGDVGPGDDIGLDHPDLLPNPSPGTDQTTTGASQWSVVRFPISQLLEGRVGSDTSRGLKDVDKIRISINATAVVTVQVDDWYITGGYGPDSVLPNSVDNTASPYYWIYRYRDSRTGAASAWSPINRSGFEVSRSRLVLSPTVSADPQVDKIDYARIGGTNNVFYTVGTGPNSGTFNDDFPDDVIAAGGEPITREDVQQIIQPFPVIDIPRSGTCDVKGTEVTWATGDKFNTAAVQGSLVIINNVPYHLYTNPTTDQQLSLSENAGTQTGVTFFIPDAALGGQTLDAVFGPYGGGESDIVVFGVRQGVLYWTLGNDPDRTRIDNQVEVTGGSETLMNGIIWDSRPFLLSNLRVFEIAVGTSLDSNNVPIQVFKPLEIANSKGLYARHGLCAGAAIFFIGDDGIYACNGGQVERISDNLGPLLPHDGVVGITVNGILPPDFTKPDNMHLEFGDNKVKWSFLDTGNVYRTWVYDTIKQGWESLDKYAFEGSIHYHREKKGVHQELIGGKDGKVYLSDGSLYQDNLVDYTSQVTTGCEDYGETRTQKQFGDVQVDALTNSKDLIVTVFTNNFANTVATKVLNNAIRTYEKVDIDSGRGATATNIGLDLSWAGNVVLHEWNPSFISRGDIAIKRVTDWYAPNEGGAAWLQGVKLDLDTYGVDKTFQVLGDDDQLIATITCNHNGRVIKPYEWTPVITHLVRLLPTDADNWLLYSEPIFVAEPDAESATLWQTQPTTFGFPAFGHVARAQIPHRSTADIVMTVTIDGVPQTYTIPGGTAGEYKKTFITLKAIKGKWFEFKFTSAAGARIYQKDVVIYGKAFGDSGPYQQLAPFGGPSRTSGALI
jgi:hypothetical protein